MASTLRTESRLPNFDMNSSRDFVGNCFRLIKCKSAQSSSIVFCIGVPVLSTRRRQGNRSSFR